MRMIALRYSHTGAMWMALSVYQRDFLTETGGVVTLGSTLESDSPFRNFPFSTTTMLLAPSVAPRRRTGNQLTLAKSSAGELPVSSMTS